MQRLQPLQHVAAAANSRKGLSSVAIIADAPCSSRRRFQRNGASIYASTLAQQMQADFARSSTDPLLNRSYGTLMVGRSLERAGERFVVQA